MIYVLKIKITKMLQCQADCNNNRARVYEAFFIEATNLIKYILYIRLLLREMNSLSVVG